MSKQMALAQIEWRLQFLDWYDAGDGFLWFKPIYINIHNMYVCAYIVYTYLYTYKCIRIYDYVWPFYLKHVLFIPR